MLKDLFQLNNIVTNFNIIVLFHAILADYKILIAIYVDSFYNERNFCIS